MLCCKMNNNKKNLKNTEQLIKYPTFRKMLVFAVFSVVHRISSRDKCIYKAKITNHNINS